MKQIENVDPVPKHREGSAKVAAALGLADFPAGKKDLDKKVGGWKIPLGNGATVPLRELLEAVPKERFIDHPDALNAIDHHWRDAIENLRESGSSKRAGPKAGEGRSPRSGGAATGARKPAGKGGPKEEAKGSAGEESPRAAGAGKGD